MQLKPLTYVTHSSSSNGKLFLRQKADQKYYTLKNESQTSPNETQELKICHVSWKFRNDDWLAIESRLAMMSMWEAPDNYYYQGENSGQKSSSLALGSTSDVVDQTMISSFYVKKQLNNWALIITTISMTVVKPKYLAQTCPQGEHPKCACWPN